MPIYNTTFLKFKMYSDNVKMKNSGCFVYTFFWLIFLKCAFFESQRMSFFYYTCSTNYFILGNKTSLVDLLLLLLLFLLKMR